MKKIILIIFLILALFPSAVFAQEDSAQIDNEEEVFKAKVIEILDQKEYTREDGTIGQQQNLKLMALDGSIKGQEFEFYGISDFEVFSGVEYKVGSKVIVQKSADAEGNVSYYIIDSVRTGYIYLLAIIFALVVIFVGSKKGIKSLISLVISFLIILYLILPQIIAGANPLIISLLGALLILVVIIYITEGWNLKSHLAILSVFFTLLITLGLSVLFTWLCNLSGLVQEEAMFLVGATKTAIDFKGLLLAGIMIGAVGVLDDVIIGQIEAVRQIKEINPNLPKKQVYKAAYQIGNTHLSAIINTLFLTYTGAALPLMLLFIVGQKPFLSFEQIINNELIATEIVRTLIGSIGVALSLPIATILAVNWLKIQEQKE